MKRILVLLACVSLSACEITKGGSPTMPEAVTVQTGGGITALPFSDNHALAILTGTEWTGVETADTGHGENGSLSVTFSQAGESGPVVGRGRYEGRLETVLFALTGTLENLVLIADVGQSDRGTRCSYGAQGARTEEPTVRGMIEVIAGRYDGRGPDPCPNKSGTFRLQRPLLPPPCTGLGKITFQPPNNAMAIFPPMFPNPWLPFSLGLFDFAIPSGIWDITVVTGHYTHPDVGQDHEMVRIPMYAEGGQQQASVVSEDVPTADASHTTVRRVTLVKPVTQIKVMHDYDGPPVPEPTHSVTIESVSFACPVR